MQDQPVVHFRSKQHRRRGVAAGLLVVVAVAGAAIAWAQQNRPEAGQSAAPAPAPAVALPVRHAVTIRPGPAVPRVLTGDMDAQGRPVSIACGTCHATTAPVVQTHSAAELDQFHQGLKYQHGNLTCLSCHNSTNYDTLRLADGRSVEFPDVMTLCSQCHGPQRRDYDHGSHGGMNGHWDLTKGPRVRNNCVNCHDAHSPRLPQVLPVLPPRDRLSVPSKKSPHEH